jgi:hypothetical protein
MIAKEKEENIKNKIENRCFGNPKSKIVNLKS